MHEQEVLKPPSPTNMVELPKGEIQSLIFYSSSALKEVSDDVPSHVWDDEDMTGILHKLIADLVTTMYATGGIGLSAPQIGIGSRVFICDPMANVKPEPGKQVASRLLVAVNPEVKPVNSAKVRMKEGCLSFPGIHEPIERFMHVRLRARDKDGKQYSMVTSGILARIVQHEQDHLDGILMTDRMGLLTKSYVTRKMKKFRRAVLQDQVRVKDEG